MLEAKSQRRRRLLALVVAVSPVTGAVAAPPTEADCHRDRELMLEAMAATRADGVRKLNIAIAESTSAAERESLTAEREGLWDVEERERVFADTAWRDCLRYVRERKARAE